MEHLQKFLHQFQHLKIPLEEIKSATDNFNDEKNRIGVGGFGKVYKGEVSHSKGRNMAAIKRLNQKFGQGLPEFLKEITMLSRYRHENLVSLLGFCHEGDEMILVYEYASRGSLDHHLNSPHLTWTQRLKICLDVAKGLSHLHDPRETHQRLIHCDIKSANILLDDQWRAKLSDFGLSKMGPANEQESVIITCASGTPGYCDLEYAMTSTLTKESDVYSLGVVLFEVLCGKLCCTYENGRVPRILVPAWIENYKKNKLNDIIFKNPTIQPLDQRSLETFSGIAYRCLKESREDRPKIAEIVTELETALRSQELSEWNMFSYYEEMTKTAEPPLKYSNKDELLKLLSKGVLLNGGKTWFSLNEKGEHCEMISFAKDAMFKTRVETQFLSPGITYTVNLVFKFKFLVDEAINCHLMSLKYKLQGETKSSVSHLAYKTEDGWWRSELYQFASDDRVVDLEILFDGFYGSFTMIQAHGIEFRPLEKVEHKMSEEEEKLDVQSISDVNWKEKLPTDYEDIMKLSEYSGQWIMKKEAYSIIRKGLLISDGQKWFSLDKNGRKCHMLSARAAGIWVQHEDRLSLPESRFGEAMVLRFWTFSIVCEIQSQLVSSQTTYASYLVYKLPEDQSEFEAPMVVKDGEYIDDYYWYIYLVRPQTPVIRPKADENTHNPLYRPEIKGLPRQRNDGWMEVQIWEFRTTSTTEKIPMCLILSDKGGKKFSGLIIQGIEFRPI
ncbi:putative protein kinase RLK-Pelle-CrRLK1L-1 family [Helianthus annuus]|nr:putative protein kinase RLK-Pelle-CrRLK1L-1 family [Helianthus annuus]KAJ0877258.1 putative protein kinase RLK-Pelle-CrRLK1L-1 family [Helianthus annuus]